MAKPSQFRSQQLLLAGSLLFIYALNTCHTRHRPLLVAKGFLPRIRPKDLVFLSLLEV